MEICQKCVLNAVLIQALNHRMTLQVDLHIPATTIFLHVAFSSCCWWGGTWCPGCRGSSIAGTLILHLPPADLQPFLQLAQSGVMPGLVGKCILFQRIKASWFLSSLLKFWPLTKLLSFPKTKICWLICFLNLET